MSKEKNVSNEQRCRIDTLRKEGLSIREIGRRLKLSKTAVFQALKSIQVTKNIEKAPRKPRPRKTTEREDRIIHRISEADRHKTAPDSRREFAELTGKHVSNNTIKRRLNEFRLMGRVCRKKPLMSKKNIAARLTFAKRHRNWTSADWIELYLQTNRSSTEWVQMAKVM
nr:uncharacterized protein LOC122271704 [Parasteatoda tepidariorum]